jgi:hypothetical protein
LIETTPYTELNLVLGELVRSIEAVLHDNFIGAYLQGSFAVGDFDRHSDVDYIVAIEEELSEGQVQDLQVMHARIYNLEFEWAQHLEGSYFPKDVLRQQSQGGRKLWYLDHGACSLIRSDHCNTLLVRWIVREQGAPLSGPPPNSLVDPIPVELLRREILATINDWGREILADPAPFSNRFYQGYLVLNYNRMLHDLIRGRPGSKREGAEWAKTNLDPTWNGLIDRAWDCRPDPARSVRQTADPDEFRKTLTFIEYVMEQSLRYAAAMAIETTSD